MAKKSGRRQEVQNSAPAESITAPEALEAAAAPEALEETAPEALEAAAAPEALEETAPVQEAEAPEPEDSEDAVILTEEEIPPTPRVAEEDDRLLYLKYTSLLSEEQLSTVWSALEEAGLIVARAECDDARVLAGYLQPHEQVDVVLGLSSVEDTSIVEIFMSRPLRGVAPVARDPQAGPHRRPNGSKSSGTGAAVVKRSPPTTVGPAVKAAAPRADDSRVIAEVAPNPKKPSSESYSRYALYKPGMTVAEFVKAGGKTADIKWDLGHGFIRVVTPAEWAARQS